LIRILNAWRQTAHRIFRIPSLRPEQESAMLAVLNARDALVALPTGFGKSLIYQVPAMIFDRPTIVISPLIVFMADQESALRRCGVPVIALHSRLRAAERGRHLKGSRRQPSNRPRRPPKTLVCYRRAVSAFQAARESM
jgi:ATP-dependent DNA helicase RecQ